MLGYFSRLILVLLKFSSFRYCFHTYVWKHTKTLLQTSFKILLSTQSQCFTNRRKGQCRFLELFYYIFPSELCPIPINCCFFSLARSLELSLAEFSLTWPQSQKCYQSKSNCKCEDYLIVFSFRHPYIGSVYSNV